MGVLESRQRIKLHAQNSFDYRWMIELWQRVVSRHRGGIGNVSGCISLGMVTRNCNMASTHNSNARLPQKRVFGCFRLKTEGPRAGHRMLFDLPKPYNGPALMSKQPVVAVQRGHAVRLGHGRIVERGVDEIEQRVLLARLRHDGLANVDDLRGIRTETVNA